MFLLYSILMAFILPIFSLAVDNNVNIKEIPEFAYYLSQVDNITSIIGQENSSKPIGELIHPIVATPFSFPMPFLCKENPKDGNLYGHIYCWGMLILFVLLIGSLIFYQIRSIIWFKSNIKGINTNKNKNQENIELGSPYGRGAN
jgi:hypothetical protein